MKTVPTLGVWISIYCDNRKITIAEFCREIGENNRNSVARVIHENAKKTASLHTLDKICMHQKNLGLTKDEADELIAIRQRIENGSKYCDSFDEFWKLFTPSYNTKPTATKILNTELILNYDTLNISNLEECTIINSCFSSAVSLVQQTINHNSSAKINHYIINEKTLAYIHNINIILPLTTISNYNIYVCSVEKSPLISASQNVIIFKCSDEDILIQYLSEDTCIIIRCKDAHTSYYNLINNCPFVGLKTPNPSVISTDTLIDVFKSFRNREEGKDIYEIGPDLCVRFFDKNILFQAFNRACISNNIEISNKTKEQLLNIHNDRVNMVYGSKNINSVIVSGTQMKAFCQTGVSFHNDINVAPFTPLERMQLIVQIYNQLCSNPHFRFFLIRDDNVLLSNPINIAVYGNETLTILPIIPTFGWATTQNIDNIAIEIHDKELASAFIDFFNNELLAKRVHSKNETLTFLKELINMLSIQLLNSGT